LELLGPPSLVQAVSPHHDADDADGGTEGGYSKAADLCFLFGNRDTSKRKGRK
jgi:hypothetical protein